MKEGIWNGQRPHEYATRLETAIMIERMSHIMEMKNINMGDKDLVRENIPDGATSDPTVSYLDDLISLSELKNKFPSCKTNYFTTVAKNKELQLDQNEFKDQSQYCTMYAHFQQALHYGIVFTKEQRKKMIDRMIKDGTLPVNS